MYSNLQDVANFMVFLQWFFYSICAIVLRGGCLCFRELYCHLNCSLELTSRLCVARIIVALKHQSPTPLQQQKIKGEKCLLL